MRGGIDEARSVDAEADAIMEDLGAGSCPMPMPASLERSSSSWRMRRARAERAARAGLEAFKAMHNRSQGSTAAALLGMALVEQGRDDQALKYADLAATWAVADDAASQVRQLAVRARVLARRGDLAAAEAAAMDELRDPRRPTNSPCAATR
jgi:hypothetical protein